MTVSPDEHVECFAMDSDGDVYWPGQDADDLAFALEERHVIHICFADGPNTNILGQPGKDQIIASPIKAGFRVLFEAITPTRQAKLVEARWTVRTPEGDPAWAADDDRLPQLLSQACKTRTLPPGLRILRLIQGSAREVDHLATERKPPERFDDPLTGWSF
ncbi:hypothetical protein C5B85_10735 [Pseudoclavibacter sp. AY1F1]|uniref:hypothetical protein n=1 Tax=Pseudoclavibacter sp. AY1F1 TaxID=2080583 RepID=UPI000CE91ADD|nr:hypothetical protein [Pseudoclavibacter sp. AY1F1]PPF44113.1 hypothetical protein C5B85_10735 [Pseudoclavibacter sp. AY1F1]